MKVVVSKDNLLAALKVAKLTVSSNADATVEKYYVFRHVGGKMEVLSMKSNLVGSSLIECTEISDLSDNEEENRFTVEAKRLDQWKGAVSGDKITFHYSKKGVITASTSRGKITFRSFPPERFRYWDSNLEAAQLVGKLPPERLLRVLKFVSPFISDNESTQADVCACEFMDNGRLYATDEESVAVVTVDGLSDARARMHGKELPQIRSWLEQCGEGDIEVLEHPQTLFLRNAQGGVIGQTRFRHQFPNLEVDRPFEEAEHWWTFSTQEMVDAIKFMIPCAHEGKDGEVLTLTREGDFISLSLNSAAGGVVTQNVSLESSREADSASALPETGFPIRYPLLLRMLDQVGGEKAEMALWYMKDQGGYIAFQYETDGDVFLMVVGWN